ncbi:MAG: low specificity L-threonine aldolase, partial [Proteobacteria bacterium]|nr:low specificity L-threonine aldolase [Pseudomonadota bacterium]
AASSELIEAAWQWKQRLGGAMRQAGIIAAAGIYALENHVGRIGEDHANARRFAERIATIPGVAVDPERVETNLVFFDVAATGLTAAELSERLAGLGIRIGASSRTRLRAVTHLDVTRAGVEEAAEAVRAVIGEAGTRPKIAGTGT